MPFANLSASEVIFGGVGTGLYSILLYVLLAVFIGGLMVGRTPEWLGKKLEAREIKLAGLGILITPLAALFCTALATASKAGRASISEGATSAKLGTHTPQAFSETFYAYLSQANNNGSAFAGYTGFIQPNAGNLGSHGLRLPTSSAASTWCSRAMPRSCSRWPSPARSPASASRPRAWARF